MKTKSKGNGTVTLAARDARYLASMLLGNAAMELQPAMLRAFPACQVMREGTAAGIQRVPEHAKSFRSDLRIWEALTEGLRPARRGKFAAA